MAKKSKTDVYTDSPLLVERPWLVTLPFSMKGSGGAMDSDGESLDGITLLVGGRKTMISITADTYWNPRAGDESGNSFVVTINEKEVAREHFPRKLDDGTEHTLFLSNSPWDEMMYAGVDGFVICSMKNPFPDQEPLEIDWEPVSDADRSKIKCSGPQKQSL